MDDFDLQRFIDAQAPDIEGVEAELRAGHKRTHWMWFVFPQLRELGHSSMALRYGIGSLAEARAYMAHPVLGPRLLHCTGLVRAVSGRTLHDIFGSPDDVKFRSCMTLFAATGASDVFAAALAQYCGGEPDPRTVALLQSG